MPELCQPEFFPHFVSYQSMLKGIIKLPECFQKWLAWSPYCKIGSSCLRDLQCISGIENEWMNEYSRSFFFIHVSTKEGTMCLCVQFHLTR